MDWLSAIAQLRRDGLPGVLVTVLEVRGHSPRDPGAKMVVGSDHTWGSVGGGNLEEEAIDLAREMLDSGTRELQTVQNRLNVHERNRYGRQCCGGVVRLLLEPLAVRPSVAVFGVGHVGFELARILSRLELSLHLVDSRPGRLDELRLAEVTNGSADVILHHAVLGEQVLEALPRGAHALVMTHDHSEDFALCDTALRLPALGSIGLIGSAAKWSRFRANLAEAGHSPEAIARIICPIGDPDILGKDPASIAIGVAAAIVKLTQAVRSDTTSCGPRSGPLGKWSFVTLFRATVMDTPSDPFSTDVSAALAVDSDGGVVVRNGKIVARGPFAAVHAQYPDEPVEALLGGVLVPGFVDTHVHYPQIRAIGGLGMPLLDWLEKCALPEESRLSDPVYAAALATDFLNGLVSSGTTSALVFGAHFALAMEVLFSAAELSGLNITTGLVVSDRILRDDLLANADQAFTESRALIERWHGRGRLTYAVTPRFSLSCTDDVLAACGALMAEPGVHFTSHINENLSEVAAVAELFPDSRDYLDSYARHGLIGPRSVLAHNVHATDTELKIMGEAGAWAAHCPTSNAALGSGLFPLKRHVEHGVGVALGSDVGAGTGLFLVKEALQAYFMQQLLGPDGLPLSPVHLLYLATRAGALALGIADRVGDLAVGKEFDAVWLCPAAGTQLEVNLANAADPVDALARVFALATPADVAGVWAAGRRLLG